MNNKSLILSGVVTSSYTVVDIFVELITYSSAEKPFPFTVFFLYSLAVLGLGAYSWWQLFKISFVTKQN